MAYDSILGIAELARKYGVFDHRVRNLLTVALYTDDAELEHHAAVYVTGYWTVCRTGTAGRHRPCEARTARLVSRLPAGT